MRGCRWILLLWSVLSGTALAQETRGNISGTVRDAQGVVPGATVTITSMDTAWAALAGGWQLGGTFEYQPGSLITFNNNLFYYGNIDDIKKRKPEIALNPNGTIDPSKYWFNVEGFEKDPTRTPTSFQTRAFPFQIDDLRGPSELFGKLPKVVDRFPGLVPIAPHPPHTRAPRCGGARHNRHESAPATSPAPGITVCLTTRLHHLEHDKRLRTSSRWALCSSTVSGGSARARR